LLLLGVALELTALADVELRQQSGPERVVVERELLDRGGQRRRVRAFDVVLVAHPVAFADHDGQDVADVAGGVVLDQTDARLPHREQVLGLDRDRGQGGQEEERDGSAHGVSSAAGTTTRPAARTIAWIGRPLARFCTRMRSPTAPASRATARTTISIAPRRLTRRTGSFCITTAGSARS